MKSVLKFLTVFSIFGFSFSAAAQVVPITNLLGKGFEIKASFSRAGSGAAEIVILLQKGSEAYYCDNSRAKYSNTFKCVKVLDWEEREN